MPNDLIPLAVSDVSWYNPNPVPSKIIKAITNGNVNFIMYRHPNESTIKIVIAVPIILLAVSINEANNASCLSFGSTNPVYYKI